MAQVSAKPQTAPVLVKLPGALVDLFPGAEREVPVTATTVSEMLDGLNERWPGMRDRLADTRPSIRPHINIFVDGERATLDTGLGPGTTVYVLTAISGG